MTLKRLDQGTDNIHPEDIIGFARVRNEALRLPWCLDYHRQLGVDRFIIVDNNSTDGTTEYLLSRPDVHLFWTKEAYADNQSGMNWINPLLKEFAVGHWTVTVDADELLVYPEVETVNLKRLTNYLDHIRADALACLLIDMYSDVAIRDTEYEAGQDFLSACPYFDPQPLVGQRGGARKRLFWEDPHRGPKANPPFLRKVPLVRWRSDLVYKTSTHIIDGVKEANISGALLHFKMFSDFHEKISVGVKEQQYWDNSAQYSRCLAELNKNLDLVALHDDSMRYDNSDQLVQLGFMRAAPRYRSFIASAGHL